MKVSAKSISSPGRADKFPPPLMRFLRTNVGSRSRGRSRSSPMFVRKKNAPALETQEPSSPKVTCMGQVRVKRSIKQPPNNSKIRSGNPNHPPKHDNKSCCRCWCRCRWIPTSVLFCPSFGRRLSLRPRLLRPRWPRWASCFRVGSRGKPEVPRGEESSSKAKMEWSFGDRSEDLLETKNEEEDDDYEVEAKARVSSPSSTPPKNALLLTRCRSAPYRSCSLASRFWGSPLDDEVQRMERENRVDGQATAEEEVQSGSEESEGESGSQPEKERFLKEIEEGSTMNLKRNNGESVARKEEELAVTVKQPLMLTRCKSEPARTAEKLDPEMMMSVWRTRRLTGTPHAL